VNGPHAELEPLCDVLVGLAAGHQLQDLPLPMGDVDRRLQQVGGERRGDVGAPLGDRADRPGDLGLVGVFGQLAPGAGADRLDHVSRRLRGGHPQHGMAAGAQVGDRLQAVTLLRQGVPPPRGAARQAPERRRPGGGGRRAGRPGLGTTSTSPTGSSTPRCASAAATRQHAGLLGLLAELRGAGPDGEGTPATLGKLKERLSRQ
jgi:hypothetical protein